MNLPTPPPGMPAPALQALAVLCAGADKPGLTARVLDYLRSLPGVARADVVPAGGTAPGASERAYAWTDGAAGPRKIALVLGDAAAFAPSEPWLALFCQVLERLEAAVAEVLEGTPFLDWLPLGNALEPLARSSEALCVLLGLLIPCLLGYSVIGHTGRRALFALLAVGVGVGVTALSSALTWGPSHAWEWWVGLPVRVGVAAGVAVAALLLPLRRRACAAVLLLALVLHLSLLNQAPTSAYFAQTLQLWEQGRFLRFYGLAQWLGWLWPYAALAYVLVRLSRREGQTYNPGP